jgi:hypothetical protein
LNFYYFSIKNFHTKNAKIFYYFLTMTKIRQRTPQSTAINSLTKFPAYGYFSLISRPLFYSFPPYHAHTLMFWFLSASLTLRDSHEGSRQVERVSRQVLWHFVILCFEEKIQIFSLVAKTFHFQYFRIQCHENCENFLIIAQFLFVYRTT